LKLFAFDLIRNEGLREYAEKNYDRACRKFEEALSIFRYYVSFNPKWQEQGIDDDEIKEVDDWDDRQDLKGLKFALYLNIAACNIKCKDYETAQAACDEALKLDPYNVKALYRRARAIALPINSGVEDFRNAIVDLKRIVENIDPTYQPALKEVKRLQALIEVNRKREKDTYSKMFTSKEGIVKPGDAKETPLNYKTVEDQEYERERAKMEARVRQQMQAKLQDFSFEVLPVEKRRHYPEMEDLQEMIEKAEESYRLFKKTGRGKDAKAIKQKLEEALFAKEHLFHVMNLDFSRPTSKLIEMARKNNIDLRDSQVIEEFRRIQQQNLEDIRRMKEGKKPLTEEEMKSKLQSLREQEHEEAK
jgi:tetratricopeptide (TPR) repeat protein